MNRKKSWLVSVFVLSVTLVLSLGYVQAQIPGQMVKWVDEKGILGNSFIAENDRGHMGVERKPIRGTGNISLSAVMRTEEPLDPPCVVLVTRISTVTYTGIIQTLAQERAEAFSLTSRCVDTPEGPFSRVDTLDEVTIAGREGGIVIEVNGTIVGDVKSSEGVRTIGQLKIRGGSGDLKGIRGHGLLVGKTTLTEGFNTYWMEIQFDTDDEIKT